MKNKSSLTVFDKLNKRNKRITALILVLVVVVTTCFSNAPMKSSAETDGSVGTPSVVGEADGPTYFGDIITAMENTATRNFTILEVVPDASMSEMRYYAADSSVTDAFNYINTNEETFINTIYGSMADGDKGSVNNSGVGRVSGYGFNAFRVMMYKNLFTSKMHLEVENIFLNYVVPEYAQFLEGRIDVKVAEANKLTTADVESADLIYINSKYHNTDTINAYLTLQAHSGNSNYVKEVEYYTINDKNEFVSHTADYNNQPSYTTYEYVKNGSAADTALINAGAFTATDSSAANYTKYKETAGTTGGYYISRDISWTAASAILDAVFEGKTFTIDASTTRTWQVPVIFDAADANMLGNKTCNIRRLHTLIRSLETEPLETNPITDGAGNTYNGYVIAKEMLATKYNVYNTYGVKTAVLNSQYYKLGDTAVASVKDADQIITDNKAVDGDKGDWENYLSYMANDGDKDIITRVQAVYDAAADKTAAEVIVPSSIYQGTATSPTDYTFIYIDNSGYQNRNTHLNKHYFAYSANNSLISMYYSDAVDVTNAAELLKEAGLINDGDSYYVTTILRYLLGVSSNTYLRKLTDGVHLKVLEIEPSASYLYTTNDQVTQLAKKMGLDTSKLVFLATDAKNKEVNSTTNVITHKPSGILEYPDGTYDVPDGKIFLDVDNYWTNAVDGLNQTFIETYDIVYIGDYIGFLTNSGGTNPTTTYRDTTLNGCLYTAYGDKVNVGNDLKGFLATDFADNKINFKSGNIVARYSGNDLSQYKMQQLESYAESGGMVIIGDKLYNPSYTYATSNMRGLLESITTNSSLKYNVLSYSNIGKVVSYYKKLVPVIDSVTVTKDASTDEISGNLSYTGTSGSYSGNVVNNVIKTGGTAIKLNFKTSISNVSSGKDYSVKVLLDKNGDGIFDEVEKDDDTNEMFQEWTGKGSAMSNLNITIDLNEKFSGLLIWKVLVQEVSTSKNIRSEKSGSIAINSRNRDIKVLQIVPGTKDKDSTNYKTNITLLMASSYTEDGVVKYVESDSKTSKTSSGSETINEINNDATCIRNPANLKREYKTTPGLYTMTEDELNGNENISDFEKLLWQTYQSIGYKIDVTVMTTDLFNEKSGNINEYDMVIVGFGDCYGRADLNDVALQDITDYVNSGKALLFSHDNVSYSTLTEEQLTKNSVDNWSPRISTIFRNYVGMNRYAVSNVAGNVGNMYVPTTDGTTKITEIQGISTATLKGKSDGIYPYKGGSVNDVAHWTATSQVAKLNDGQITQYPFNIDETINVASTHSQYYQLDLEVPYTVSGATTTYQEDQKVMVWYTLGGSGYFTDSAKDAVNNYYIYSKANITYTGAGHSTILERDGTAASMAELKLFVNTIVKAITAGNFAPEITVANAQQSSGVWNIYITDNVDPVNCEIKFTATDEDLPITTGRFAKASLIWTDNGYNGAAAKEHVLVDYGNTLCCGVETTYKISAAASLGDEDYARLKDEISKGTADFTIKVTDGRGAEAVANVNFAIRQLFELD